MPTKKAVAEIVDNLEVVDEVVDKAIDGVDAVDHASHVAAVVTKRGLRNLKNPKVAAAILIAASMAVGASLGVAGYFAMKKRLEKKYEVRLQEEIDEVRASYKRRVKRQEFSTPEEAAEALKVYQEGDDHAEHTHVKAIDLDRLSPKERAAVSKAVENILGTKTDTELKVVRGAGGEPGYVETETETVVEENVFIEGRPINPFEWDQEVELSKRDTESPYVISFEEFNENSTDWEQNNLVYYEGDDVLADERDNPIPEIEATIGYDNLNRFGHGSQDPNVVYIRNERTEALFEVIRNEGKFADQVVGFRHSDSPRKRRGRRDWGDDE